AFLLFADAATFTPEHVAFLVTEERFAKIVAGLEQRCVGFGNDPEDPRNGRTDDPHGGGRRVYWTDDNGLLLAASSCARGSPPGLDRRFRWSSAVPAPVGRTAGRLLAAGEVFDQVGRLLGGQTCELAVGHQRQPRRLQHLDALGREDGLLVLGVPQDHRVLVP